MSLEDTGSRLEPEPISGRKTLEKGFFILKPCSLIVRLTIALMLDRTRLRELVIMPLAIKFFLSFESTGLSTNLPIQLEAKVNEYLSLVMKLIFAFGISFQLPVVLSLLARVGIVDSQFLKSRRKYVVVIIFAAAALLTPPDPITQVGLAIPLLILYELSIFSVRFIENKNFKKTDA